MCGYCSRLRKYFLHFLFLCRFSHGTFTPCFGWFVWTLKCLLLQRGLFGKSEDRVEPSVSYLNFDPYLQSRGKKTEGDYRKLQTNLGLKIIKTPRKHDPSYIPNDLTMNLTGHISRTVNWSSVEITEGHASILLDLVSVSEDLIN